MNGFNWRKVLPHNSAHIVKMSKELEHTFIAHTFRQHMCDMCDAPHARSMKLNRTTAEFFEFCSFACEYRMFIVQCSCLRSMSNNRMHVDADMSCVIEMSEADTQSSSRLCLTAIWPGGGIISSSKYPKNFSTLKIKFWQQLRQQFDRWCCWKQTRTFIHHVQRTSYTTMFVYH